MPISHESQYCLDSAFELLGITADVHSWAYDSALNIDGIIDDRDLVSRNLTSILYQRFGETYPSLPALERAHICLHGLLGSQLQFREAGMNIASAIIDNNLTATDDIARAVSGNRYVGPWLELVNGLWQRVEQDLLRFPIRAVIDRENAIRLQRQITRTQEREAYRVELEQAYDDMRDVGPYENWREGTRTKLARRDLQRKGQKVMKKSAIFMQKVAGVENTRLFLSGKSFTVSGNEFAFRFSRGQYNMISHSASPEGRGHIPYRLDLLTLNGMKMASGCIYLQDTPILDQVSGIILHIKAGNEYEIVRTTNWSDTSPEYKAHPYIQQLAEQRAIEWNRRQEERQLAASLHHGQRAVGLSDEGERITMENIMENMSRVMGDTFNRRNGEGETNAQRTHREYFELRDSTIPRAHDAIKAMLNVPPEVVDFMIRPPIQYDELQMLDVAPTLGILLENSMANLSLT